MFSHTVVEDYINKTKTTLGFNFELYQDFQLQHGHTHIYIYIYTNTYTYIYIYIYMETDRIFTLKKVSPQLLVKKLVNNLNLN